MPCLDLNNIVRFVPASCATSVAQLVEHSSREQSVVAQVSLNCAVFLCVYLEGVSKFVYHVYTWFGVGRLWWFNYPGLLLNTKLEFACCFEMLCLALP